MAPPATGAAEFIDLLGPSSEWADLDPINTAMVNLPTTVISSTLEGPLDWPNAVVASGNAVDVVARLRKESPVPLRAHGSLSMNRALMAAGLVDGSIQELIYRPTLH